MVSEGFKYASSQANIHNKFSEAIGRTVREAPPFSTEQHSYTSGLEGFREKLSTKRISQETAKLNTRLRRTGTLGNYESACNKWSGWYHKWKTDPFQVL